jgi:hypothetical protein
VEKYRAKGRLNEKYCTNTLVWSVLMYIVSQQPPVHHPLDACYYSVVDETSTELIFVALINNYY